MATAGTWTYIRVPYGLLSQVGWGPAPWTPTGALSVSFFPTARRTLPTSASMTSTLLPAADPHAHHQPQPDPDSPRASPSASPRCHQDLRAATATPSPSG